MVIQDPDDVERLVERTTDLLGSVQSYQDDLGVSGKVENLQKQANANQDAIRKGGRARRIVTAVVVVAVLFTGTVGYNTIRLEQLVHTECVRSVRGAELREKLIDALTDHVVLPSGSSASQRELVETRNSQLDDTRRTLEAVGSQIPKVKC